MAPATVVAATIPKTLPEPVFTSVVGTAGVVGGVAGGVVVVKLIGFAQVALVATCSTPFTVNRA